MTTAKKVQTKLRSAVDKYSKAAQAAKEAVPPGGLTPTPPSTKVGGTSKQGG